MRKGRKIMLRYDNYMSRKLVPAWAVSLVDSGNQVVGEIGASRFRRAKPSATSFVRIDTNAWRKAWAVRKGAASAKS